MVTWLERQLLCALTGWSWGEVERMSRAQVRGSLIFRDEYHKAKRKG